MVGGEFEDELLLALNPKDAVRVAKNVGAEADFKPVPVPLRFDLMGEVGWVGFS